MERSFPRRGKKMNMHNKYWNANVIFADGLKPNIINYEYVYGPQFGSAVVSTLVNFTQDNKTSSWIHWQFAFGKFILRKSTHKHTHTSFPSPTSLSVSSAREAFAFFPPLFAIDNGRSALDLDIYNAYAFEKIGNFVDAILRMRQTKTRR